MPSTGRDTVLEPKELSALVDAGKTIQKTFTPVLDASGQPKPWDIEFGFAAGKLWLFQCRPFQGNDQLKNIPALAPLDGCEVLAGLGAIDAGAEHPDVLVTDERFGPGLGEVLGRVLLERARQRRPAA